MRTEFSTDDIELILLRTIVEEGLTCEEAANRVFRYFNDPENRSVNYHCE